MSSPNGPDTDTTELRGSFATNDPPTTEQTQFSLDMALFYGSCTVCGTAAAFATVALIVFSHLTGGLVVGIAAIGLTLVSSLTAWHFLARARLER